MNLWVLRFCKILPFLTFIFTLTLIFAVLSIDSSSSNWFIVIILFTEIYLNWIAIHLATYVQINNDNHEFSRENSKCENSIIIDLNSTTSVQKEISSNNLKTFHKAQNGNISPNINIEKIWYCTKCLTNTPTYSHHCPLCNKCIILRDHHCFFLGACICWQNMTNFIVFCLYITITSLYVNFYLFPYLYKQIANDEEHISFSYILAQCFFPFALSKWLLGESTLKTLSLVFLFDMLITTGIVTFSFSLYQLFFATSVKNQQNFQRQDNYAVSRINKLNFNNNFSNIFGKCGVINFLFPIILWKKILKNKHLQMDFKFN